MIESSTKCALALFVVAGSITAQKGMTRYPLSVLYYTHKMIYDHSLFKEVISL